MRYRRLRRWYLRLLHSRGGIEAINRHLLRVERVDETLRLFGAQVGEEGVLHGPLVVHNAAGDYRNLRVGAGVHLGRLTCLDLAAPVTIGDRATISMGTTILTHTEAADPALSAALPRVEAATTIGAGSYLGANVTVLPGCHVGQGAIVGAGAVVTRPVADGAVVAGVPARERRS